MSKNRNFEQQVTTTQPPEDTTSDEVNNTSDVGTEAQTPVETKVQQQVVTTQPPVVEKQVVKKQENLDSFETRISFIKENGSLTEKQVVTVLENYVKVCTTSISLEAIAIEQQRFWRLLEYIHSNPTEFRKLFNIVIDFGKKYKDTAFDISMFYRAQGALSLTGSHLEAFNNIRTLIINTINTNNKSSVKSLLEIRKIIENDAIPEHVRSQYVAYYE